MKRLIFDVAIAAPTETDPDAWTEHRVKLVLADQLRGELEGKKRGLSVQAHPVHASALWVWAGVNRTGVWTGTFEDFQKACLEYEKVGEAEPDPTTQAASPDSA